MSEKRYSKTFMLAFKDKYTEPPAGFHPVYIKQKRVQCGSKNVNVQRRENAGTKTSGGGGGKWDNLEKIRAFTSSENSFIQRTRNRSSSEILIGEIRSLLNKVTDKTFNAIVSKLDQLDYSKFNDDMIKQTVKIYISKAIADKDYGMLYAEIGNTLITTFKTFKTEFEKNSLEMLDDLFTTTSINEIQKSKCLGFMRVLPFLIGKDIIDPTVAKEKIIDKICTSINEKKHLNESYAQVASTGGCGIYIELLCKFCDQFYKCNKSNKSNLSNTQIDIDHIIELLQELKTLKSIPSRVRFMIEDTLDELKK